MKLLSTKFYLEQGVTRDNFMEMACMQLAKDQDSSLDFSGFDWHQSSSVLQNGDQTEVVGIHNFPEVFILEVKQSLSGGVTRICTYVVRDKDEQPSMYVSLEKETSAMNVNLEDHMEIPSLLQAVFWYEWGGTDEWMQTDDQVHILRRNGVGKMANLFLNKGNCMDTLLNPVVYLSVDDSGACPFDGVSIARELVGQAHVWQEASPVISMQMQSGLKDKQVSLPKGGDAAILFPGGETFLVTTNVSNPVAEIARIVRQRLLSVSVGEQYDAAKLKNQNLVNTLSSVVQDDELSEAFESLLNEKQQKVDELLEENGRLKQEIARLSAKAASLQDGFEKSDNQEGGKFITLQVSQGELYDGEEKDVVLKALAQVRDSMTGDLTRVRKYHVLSDVLEHNFPCKTDARLIECIRGAFEDGTLTRQGIGRLRSAGFIVDNEGRSSHIKISREAGDNCYTAVFSSTPSDKNRGMKNFVSEFSNMLFGY